MGEFIAKPMKSEIGIPKNYGLKRFAQQQDPGELLFLLIVFVLCPFLAFILALTRARNNSSYVIYALFGLIFVWHMSDRGSTTYDDFIGIISRVKNSSYSFDEIKEQLWLFVTFDVDAPKEWYEMAMIWLSKCFTDNPHFYFVLCAVPWLFFELSSLRKITSDFKFSQSLICLVILALFVMPRDIITLQNPRFTTATWMAIYSTIGFFSTSSKNHKVLYLLLILATPLIHSGFWFYVIIFPLGLFMIRFQKVSLWLLYLSIPFSFLSYDIFSSVNLSVLPIPTALNAWVEIYLSEESYAQYISHAGASGFYWIGIVFSFIMKTAYLLIPIYLIKDKQEYAENKKLSGFVAFFIFFYAAVSFIQFIPVLGTRFYWLVRILGIYLWFKAIFPRRNWVIWLILSSCTYDIFMRYFYNGAVKVAVPPGIWYEPLPLLIMDNL